MKNLLFVISLVYSSLVVAQSKFSAGLTGSFDITGLSPTDEARKNNIPVYDEPMMGYQGGLRARYDFTKNISVQTGFSLASHTVGSGVQHYTPLDPLDNNVPRSAESFLTFKNWNVPVLFSFYAGQKVRFGLTVGGAYNYTYRLNTESNVNYPMYNKDYTNTEKVNSQNQYLTLNGGVGVEYTYKKFIFRAEPMGSYQVHYFNNPTANENYRLWSAGLSLSSFYKF